MPTAEHEKCIPRQTSFVIENSKTVRSFHENVGQFLRLEGKFDQISGADSHDDITTFVQQGIVSKRAKTGNRIRNR